MKKILIAAVTLVLLGAGGFIAYKNTPMKRHARHLVKARILSTEGDMSAALQEYRIAYDIVDEYTPWISFEVLRLTNRQALQDKDPATALENTRKFVDANPDNDDGLVILAELAFQARETELAFSSIGKILSRNPGHFAARLLLARVRTQQGRLDLAEEQLRALYTAVPDSANALIPLAENLLRQGQIAESREFLRKVVEQNPLNGMARLLLVDGYLLERKTDSARAILDAWSQADPSLTVSIAVRKASLDAMEGKFESARAALQPHLERKEANLPAFSEWALLEARQGRYDSAMEVYSAIADIKPALRGETLLMRAYLSLKTRNPARALEALKTLDVGDRSGGMLSAPLAATYTALGQDHKVEELAASLPDSVKPALKNFLAQLEKDPEFIGQWALISYAQANRQSFLTFTSVRDLHSKWPRNSMAIALWSSQLAAARQYGAAAEALASLPNPPLSQRMLLLGLWLRAGKPDKGKALAEKLLAEDPSRRGLNLFLADYHFTRKERDKALAFYEKELALDTSNLVAANNLAWEHGVTGKDLAKARPYLEKLRSNKSQDPRILDTVGWILVLNGDASGEAHLRTAVTLVPDNPTFNYHLGWSLAQGGKKEEAKARLQAAVSSKFPFNDRAEAEKVLAGL